MLKNTAERLNIYDETVINKAEEYLRIYHGKGGIKTLNDQAKTVLCFDLASTFLGKVFDKEAALPLSGLKKSQYLNNLNTVEKLLDLKKDIKISDLCVQLGCTAIKDDAEEILNKYKQLDKKIKDFEHPQYMAAAVYIACKAKKVSIEKSHIISISRLKPSQWKELVSEFEQLGLTKANMKSVSKGHIEEDIQNTEQYHTSKTEQTEEYEEYEVWKKRILEKAYAALEKEKEATLMQE